MPPVSSLYALTQRLVLTPAAELPQITKFLLSLVYSSSAVLSRPLGPENAKGDHEFSVLIHKLKTRLSSLLQDQDPRARWAAVILIKATVEAGGWEILNGCASWLRGIITILGVRCLQFLLAFLQRVSLSRVMELTFWSLSNSVYNYQKPNNQILKRSCLVTATRILVLVRLYPTLVREIANPILPSLISACIAHASADASSKSERELNTNTTQVLESFSELIYKYPSLFRPFRSKVWLIATHCLGSASISHPAHKTACRTLVQLHQCASKNGIEAEWEKLSRSTISALHDTVDQLFRSVKEDWGNPDPLKRGVSVARNFEDDVCGEFGEPLKLPKWKGINQGIERLESLLSLLRSLADTTTSASMPFPAGSILNAISRLTALTVPSSDRALHLQVRIHAEATRLEREELFAALPRIHVCSLQLLTSLMGTFKMGFLSVIQSLTEQALCVFEAEKDFQDVRTECYNFLSASLSFLAHTWSRANAAQLSKLIQQCCRDILPNDNSRSGTGATDLKSNAHHLTNGTTQINADAFLTGPEPSHSKQTMNKSGAQSAAICLLPKLITYMPPNVMPVSLRAELDRTAILSRQKEAMLASVLNPMPVRQGKKPTPSIIPFLARECGNDLLAEGVLRPRLPTVPDFLSKESDFEDPEDDAFLDQQNERSGLFDKTVAGDTVNVDANVRESRDFYQNEALHDRSSSEVISKSVTVAKDTPSPEQSMDTTVTFPNQASKRAWLTANGASQHDDVILPLAHSGEPQKKPRISEEGIPQPPLSAQPTLPTIQPHTLPHSNKPSGLAANDSNTTRNEFNQETLDTIDNHQAPAMYDSNGDSDFEIPAIDATMETDDEEQVDSQQN
ncbi:MAG: hypothetical protein Q9160_001290 [Pyrenula sp. 1 TL-2023]